MTLKKINEKLDMMFNANLNVPSEVVRVSDLSGKWSCISKAGLSGIKFICRDTGFNLDFETFAEVKAWFKDLMEDHIQLLEDEIDTIKEFIK